MLPDSENQSKKDPETYLRERFGVSVPKELEISERHGDFWLGTDPGAEVETDGIRAIRDTGKYLKPTTYLLQLIEDRITGNIVNVSRDELESLLEGDMIERDLEQKGYVAIRYDGKVLGCGLYKDGLVSSRIPKGRGKELLEIL